MEAPVRPDAEVDPAPVDDPRAAFCSGAGALAPPAVASPGAGEQHTCATERIRRRVAAMGPCIGIAILYGAAVGGAYGALLFLPNVFGIPLGFVFGGVLGGGGGILTGLVGALIPGRFGWGLAGFLGGTAAMLGYLPLVTFQRLGDPPAPYWWQVLEVAGPPLLGAVIGYLIGRGVEGYRSRLPGVEYLAAELRTLGAIAPVERARPGDLGTADLVPIAHGDGRGDELSS